MEHTKRQKKNKIKHIKIIHKPWDKENDEVHCVNCATSCQSACKTSCTVGNIPCDKKR